MLFDYGDLLIEWLLCVPLRPHIVVVTLRCSLHFDLFCSVRCWWSFVTHSHVVRYLRFDALMLFTPFDFRCVLYVVRLRCYAPHSLHSLVVMNSPFYCCSLFYVDSLLTVLFLIRFVVCGVLPLRFYLPFTTPRYVLIYVVDLVPRYAATLFFTRTLLLPRPSHLVRSLRALPTRHALPLHVLRSLIA